MEVILAVSSYLTAISGRIDKRNTLKGTGENLAARVEGHVGGGVISPDGTIVVTGNDPAALVVLRPSAGDGKLRWKCAEFPFDSMPAMCREMPVFRLCIGDIPCFAKHFDNRLAT